MTLPCQVQRAADVLEASKRLLVLSGAGLSADAGVSTFRGHGGIWGDVDPEELASLNGFQKIRNWSGIGTVSDAWKSPWSNPTRASVH